MRKSPEGFYQLDEEITQPFSLLKQSVPEFNAWREEHPDGTLDFHGLDFSDADLRGVNLSKANLSHANFFGADLSDAKLAGAELTGATFSGAILTRIDIPLSMIEGVDLRNTTLTRKQFEEYVLALRKTITFPDAE